MGRTKRVKIVQRDDLFGEGKSQSRQIKVQPANCNMYQNASWVVAGVSSSAVGGEPWVSYLSRLGAKSELKDRVRIALDPKEMDLSGHMAFCHGHMPPYVYADWLEERGIDLPEEAFRILRWQN